MNFFVSHQIMLLLLVYLSTLFYSVFPEDCPFIEKQFDKQCEEAKKFSAAANEACRKNVNVSPLCKNDGEQLRRRFTIVLQTDQQYEDICNPCTSSSCPKDGIAPLADKCDPPKIIDKAEDLSTFKPRFNWHQDKTGASEKDRKCCVTTKRMIPFLSKCGVKCYLVYCPRAGGYQWRDEVRCNVTEADIKNDKYGDQVTVPSRGRCSKSCRTEWTDRAYLVTNEKPEGFFGHCFKLWLPVWFKTIKVATHCYCPRI